MKNNVEQAEQSVSKIGKFKSVSDLLSAYNALETEFTKRCQLVRELQAELAERAAQSDGNGTAAAPSWQQPQPAQDADAQIAEREDACDAAAESVRSSADRADDACATVGNPAAEGARDADAEADAALAFVAQNIAELAESLCDLPEIMDACIARYKRRLLDGRLTAVPRGAAVITPIKRPKTLTDAKRVADALLAGG